jgi:hypothetical protein
MKLFLILPSLILFLSINSFAQQSEAIVIIKREIPIDAGTSGTTNMEIGMPLGAGTSGTTNFELNLPIRGGISETTARIVSVPLSAGPSGTTDRMIGIPLGAGTSGTTGRINIYEIEDINTGEIFESYPTDLEFSPGQHVFYLK